MLRRLCHALATPKIDSKVLGIVANRVKRHPALTKRCWALVASELREKYDTLLGKSQANWMQLRV